MIPTYETQFDEYLINRDSLLNQPFDILSAISDLLGGISAENLQSGIIGGLDDSTGIEVNSNANTGETFLQSRDFVTGVSGWKISSDGSIEANSGTFRGALVANSIDIPDAATANSFHVDSSGNVWWGSTVIGSATAKVLNTGEAVFTNITATGTINALGGYLGAADTVINISTSGLNVGTTGHIRGGATDYLTGVGFFLGYSTDAYKFSVGNPNGYYIAWNGTEFDVNGFVLSSFRAFGGDGSDGALNISSGTTTIDCGGLPFLTKNYTSISITGSAILYFNNPAAGGTIVILKSQGDVTITSTAATGAIQVTQSGAAGGTGGAPGVDGSNGEKGLLIFGDESSQGVGGESAVPGTSQTTGGAKLTTTGFYSVEQYVRLSRKNYVLACGSGGGGGGGGTGTGIIGGNGGRGGGTLMIECGGALNFGTNAKIYANGSDGADGLPSAAGYGSAGGGGGAGGMVLILYNSLTANEGLIYTNGGSGGDGGATLNSPPGGSTAGSGGSGGGGYGGNGGYGGTSTEAGQAGQGAGAGGGGGGSMGYAGGSTLGGGGGTSISCIVATNYDLV